MREDRTTTHRRTVARPLLAAIVVGGLGIGAHAVPETTPAPRVVPSMALEQTVIIDTLKHEEDRISAVLENRGTHMIGDVVVMVRYNWLWKDEHDPGPGHPGRVDFVTLEQHLMPGERVTFVHTPREPLPQRDDGWFMPTATVVGASIYAERE